MSGSPAPAEAPPQQPADLRLLLPALASWSGAAVGSLAPRPVVWALMVGSLVGAALAGSRRATVAAALVLLAAGTGVAAIGSHARTGGPVARAAALESGAEVGLTVTGDPRPLPAQPHLPPSVILTARLEVLTVGGRSWRTRQPVLVIAPAASWQALLPSTGVGAKVSLRAAEGGDVAALVIARGPPRVTAAPSVVQRWAARVRAGLRTAAAGLPASERGLLPGLVLGDTTGMPEADVEAFRAAGLSHLTAVSGANVAIVVGVIFAVLSRTPLGIRGRAAASAVAVVAFVVLVRPSPSVLRAGAMGLLALLAIGLGRPRALLPALLAVVTGFALFAPLVVLQPGFALSVLATAALIVLTPGWTVAFRGHLPRRLQPLAPGLAVALAAQAACSPLVVGIGGALNLSAVVANILAIPAVAMTTVIGLLAAVTSLWLPGPALVLCRAAGLPCRWLIAVARGAAHVPLTELAVPAGIGGALVTAALVGACAVALRHRAGRRAVALTGLVAVVARLCGVH